MNRGRFLNRDHVVEHHRRACLCQVVNGEGMAAYVRAALSALDADRLEVVGNGRGHCHG